MTAIGESGIWAAETGAAVGESGIRAVETESGEIEAAKVGSREAGEV